MMMYTCVQFISRPLFSLFMLQAHGDIDPTVPCLWGQMTAQLLGNFLTKHEFKLYKVIYHTSNLSGLDIINRMDMSSPNGI